MNATRRKALLHIIAVIALIAFFVYSCLFLVQPIMFIAALVVTIIASEILSFAICINIFIGK